MPITQQRVLELLKEGEEFAEEYELLFKDVRAILEAPYEDSRKIAALVRRVNIVPKPRVLLVIERKMYNMTHSRNEYLMRKKSLDRELVRVKRERPEAYVEPPDKVEQLFSDIERNRSGAKPDYSHLQEPLRVQTPPGVSPFANESDDGSPNLPPASLENPPKPIFWQRPEPRQETRVAIHEANELARVADEMEKQRLRQIALDREAMGLPPLAEEKKG